MRNYRMRMAGSKAAEIFIYDEVSEWGVSASRFVKDLKDLGNVTTINLRINSPGGSVFDGVAIYNALKRHPAQIIVDIDGIALSIASVIAMAGNVINMAKNAMFMIHDPWGFVGGTADDLRQQADLMDQVKGNLVKTYADRTKREASEIESMMSDETWMNAESALAHGFVDSISEELHMSARFDPKRFRNTPKDLARAATEQAPSDMHRGKIAALAARASEYAKPTK